MAGTNDRVYWYGTPAGDVIDGFYGLDAVMYGGAGADTLKGGIQEGSNTVLIGGQGRDLLYGISQHNTFRFSSLTDSYRDATSAHSDQVKSFDPDNDTLDLTLLGITSLGDGYGGTLKLMYNESQQLTYLKSFEDNAQGQRFELVLQGDYSQTLSNANFVPLMAGTAYNDELTSDGTEGVTLAGYGGRDRLSGTDTDERLEGGAGGDTLYGGAGSDTFVFGALADSLKSDGASGTRDRDLITDFSQTQGDLLDLSALGFTGFGDGHNGTLKVTVNAAGDKTAIKSLDADSEGKHFEIMFDGNVADQLNRQTVIFGNTTGDQVQNNLTWDDQEIVGSDQADLLEGGDARDEILGFGGDDTIVGGTGHDSIAGGKGADVLTGGADRDDFVFYDIGESYRTATEDHSDLITDYSKGDILFALDLGFTKVGNGTAGTLKLDYDASTDRTYLHSLQPDDAGRYFQVTLAGEHDDVSIVLDGLYVDEPVLEIIGVDPTGPSPV